MRSAVGATRTEVATDTAFGRAAPPPPWPRTHRTPLGALEDAIRPALRRPPCVVSYSGGRDSALLLAVASRLAARESLPAPVAVTLRFPGVREAEESRWQETGVAGLALADWVRLEPGPGELDLLGPDATSLLVRHGVTWPYNLHFHAPVLRVARGGSVLVGADGDGLFDGWRWSRTASILAGRRSPRPADLLAFALAWAPRPVAAVHLARRDGERLDWLTADAAREHARAWGRELAEEPRTWARRVRWFGERRVVDLVRRSFALAGADEDCVVDLPLMAPAHLAAIAAAGGRLGYRNRTDVLRRAYAGTLPDALAARTSKASFDPVFWGPRARAFAAGWDGSGVDAALVDHAALRREWARPDPHAASCHLLQAAWLASAEAQEELDRRGE